MWAVNHESTVNLTVFMWCVRKKESSILYLVPIKERTQMDFNTFLLRLGIDSENFENKAYEPVKTPEGFIYEVQQRKDIRTCPYCHNDHCEINGYYYTEVNCSETDQIKDILRIRKVRFRCKDCGKTFSPEIRGIERYSKTSSQTINMIVQDFRKLLTFAQIAEKYDLTRSRIIQIFDEKITFVPRRKMPMVLCIDEIRFKGELNQNYCCVLYDFEKRNIVDIIKNRQLPYLDEYLTSIPLKERENVRFFVSDMYDGYRTVRSRYFKKAIHIIDLFHVITQLTNAVNRIRVNALKKVPQYSIKYNFMKTHWKVFLCRKENIPDRFYVSRKTGSQYHYDDLVFKCVTSDKDLLEAYNCLQDLYHYNQKDTFTEAVRFVDFLAARMKDSSNEFLQSVGYTYDRWRIEIASGLAKNQNNVRYTNGIAESINNHLKTIIKTAYGYHNFERFRKRAMLIITYKTPK
jgi:transposase